MHTILTYVFASNLSSSIPFQQPEPVPFINRGTTYASPLTSTLGLLGDVRAPRRAPRGDPRRDGMDHPAVAAAAMAAVVAAGVPLEAQLPVSDTTITLSVPDELIGNIFGRGGATMREIIALSCAKIVVSPRGEFAEGTTNRLVTITGSPTAAQTAHLFITQRLHVSSLPNSSTALPLTSLLSLLL